MIEIIQKENENRKDYMLRVAAAYIDEYCQEHTIIFDEAECDGGCIAEDCRNAAEYGV